MIGILFFFSALISLQIQAGAATFIQIKHAFIREMAPGQHSAAGYFKIKNIGKRPVLLVRISSFKAEKVNIHRMIYQHGMIKMKMMKQLRLLPKQAINLEPGHKHLMLQQVSHRLIHGEQVTLKFYFSDKSQLKVILPVKKV